MEMSKIETIFGLSFQILYYKEDKKRKLKNFNKQN